MGKTRVLVVDDSALIRSLLTKIIDGEPDMQVVGCAPDPLRAREMIRELDPDVLTLDIEMPGMDGLDFLERLMRLRPMPVIMVSTLTERGSEATLRAMELGAVDFVAKPRLDIVAGIEATAAQITDRIRVAARARVRTPPATPRPRAAGLRELGDRRLSTEKIIAIGASTGGTEALRELLVELPPDAPGIVITQHMPAGFTRTFANRLNGLCRIAVKEAEHAERVLPGHAYVAPGDHHLAIRRNGANYVVALSDGPPVNRHRPSVEVLFLSVAEHVGPNAFGVMLTGMGKDGAAAMLEMRRAGAYNLAQDEASCVVFGMPREAIAAGAVHEIVPLGAIAARLMQQLQARPHGTRV